MIEKLTIDQIRKDNPHLGQKIRFIDYEKFPSPTKLGFICSATFGAHNSMSHNGRVSDAWVSYVWSPIIGWCLGEN